MGEEDNEAIFATLTGSEEVPAQTSASGDTVFRVSDDQMTMRFRLIVNNLANMTEAHIHLGRRGKWAYCRLFIWPCRPCYYR